MDEREWEQLLHIKTAGRDDSHSDGEHHPYEPTDYGVLERLANSGYIGKKDTLIDYGSGKGRVSFFLAYQTRCQAIGVEYDRRLWEKALANGQTAASRRRVTFVLADAVEYEVPPQGIVSFLQPLCPAHAEAGPGETFRRPLPGAAADAPVFLLSL